jgi:shikimate kinase
MKSEDSAIKNVIALIGFMGTGKTSVGRILAQNLGYAFIDLDKEIIKMAHSSISEIFAVKGEPAFRELESQMLSKATSRSNVVIACGGGIVLREENRSLLSDKAVVVWLQNSVETSVDRCNDGTRPLLNVADTLDKAKELYAGRLRLYRSIAQLVVDSEIRNIEDIAGEIFSRIRKMNTT